MVSKLYYDLMDVQSVLNLVVVTSPWPALQLTIHSQPNNQSIVRHFAGHGPLFSKKGLGLTHSPSPQKYV